MLLSDNRRLGLQTLIAADVGARRNVATRTIAASRRAVGQRDPEPFAEEEDEEEGGCWVKYGWRRRLRRLPPLLPSLRRAGTRTHSSDGRLVITREPAPERGRVVATRLDGRLILDLVDTCPEHPPLRQRLPPHPSIAQETDASAETDEEEEEEADIARARGRDVPAAVWAPMVASSSPAGSAAASPVACFEAVIRMSPLRKVPYSVPRMVH